MGVMAALVGLQTGLSMYGQHQQAKQQQAMYQAQAQAAQQNAAIISRQREQQAEAYAQKQSKLNDKLKIARGQALAAAGASGLTADGSVLDAIGSMEDEHRQDSMNLLQNQRNDSWGAYVNEVNARNQANAYSAAAANAKAAGRRNMLGTLIGGAASIYALKGKSGSEKPAAESSNNAWYEYGMNNIAINQNPYANVDKYGLDLITGKQVGPDPYAKLRPKKNAISLW